MILETLEVTRDDFERRTGWSFRPEGACKGAVCVPIAAPSGERFNVRAIAEGLNMPLIQDEASGVWCLGPESGGRGLTSVEAPDFALADARGGEFHLRSLRGQKVLLAAWASW